MDINKCKEPNFSELDKDYLDKIQYDEKKHEEFFPCLTKEQLGCFAKERNISVDDLIHKMNYQQDFRHYSEGLEEDYDWAFNHKPLPNYKIMFIKIYSTLFYGYNYSKKYFKEQEKCGFDYRNTSYKCMYLEVVNEIKYLLFGNRKFMLRIVRYQNWQTASDPGLKIFKSSNRYKISRAIHNFIGMFR